MNISIEPNTDQTRRILTVLGVGTPAPDAADIDIFYDHDTVTLNRGRLIRTRSAKVTLTIPISDDMERAIVAITHEAKEQPHD